MKSYFCLFMIASFLSGCSGQTKVDGRLDAKGVAVALMVLDTARAVKTEADFKLKVRVTNVGGALLPALGKEGDYFRVGASYHWLGTDNRVVVWDGKMTFLSKDLGVGDSQDFLMNIRAPSEEGVYILEIDFLQNSAFWFAGVGSQVARVLVKVNK
ncbi:hypothetical protein ACFONG_10005 [Uliginosibacterium paludis]|uniref:Intracellular proteinase inhibitor BsuPI domain-containing protein n=1 Tax=Uliginosibacterium paludis TaxID=1615952 RepID=A0ABV2CMS8_9RHOO